MQVIDPSSCSTPASNNSFLLLCTWKTIFSSDIDNIFTIRQEDASQISVITFTVTIISKFLPLISIFFLHPQKKYVKMFQCQFCAAVAELADALDSKSSG